MNFFIIGGYSYSNPGDEAILKTTLTRLDRLHPGSHFTIWYDRRDFSVKLDPGIQAAFHFLPCPWFFSKKGPLESMFMGCYRRAYPLSAPLVRRLSSNGAAIIEKMRESDFILFIGGGYLNSQFNLLQMRHLYELARESGRPVFLLGQTIGPFQNERDRRIAEDMCEGARSVVLREEPSRSELPRSGKKALIGGDDGLAFQSGLPDDDSKLLEKYFEGEAIVLGLNLKKTPSGCIQYPALVEALNRFSDTMGGHLRVVFVPMETSVYCDDRSEAIKLRTVPGKRFDLRIIEEALSVENRGRAIARCTLFAGMRFHSLVFAVSSAVPSVALYEGPYYERKMRGLLTAYEIPEWGLPMKQVSELPEKLSRLHRERDRLREHLRRRQSFLVDSQESLYQSLFKLSR